MEDKNKIHSHIKTLICDVKDDSSKSDGKRWHYKPAGEENVTDGSYDEKWHIPHGQQTKIAHVHILSSCSTPGNRL